MKDRDMLCPVWVNDDFTKCFRLDYLEYLFPLILVTVSVIVIAFKVPVFLKAFKPVELEGGNETDELLANTLTYGTVEGDSQNGTHVSHTKSHFDLSRIAYVNSDGTPKGHVEILKKSNYDIFCISIEFICIAVQLALSISMFFVKGFKTEWADSKIPITRLFFWSYLFVLKYLRVFMSRRYAEFISSLRYHSTNLYIVNFFISLILLRSAIIKHDFTKPVATFYVSSAISDFLLTATSLTVGVSDFPVELYVASEGAIPSIEPAVSFWGFITYSWIDSLIIKASKGPVLLEDIWSLAKDDYALPVLNLFHASKTVGSFSYRLFSHFKYLFLVQITWAIFNSFIVFVPSVLLNNVLKYVDDQTLISKNLAWTLVVFMPIAKLCSSLATGASLYLGRRVCVRMRAILISEVFAKALRRKTTTTTKKISEKDSNPAKKIETSTSASLPSEDDSKDNDESTSELGAIINLMAVDSYKITEICGYLHYLIQAICMIVFCLTLLYRFLGWSSLVGAASLIALAPLNYKLSIWLGEAQKETLYTTDKRIQILNETLQSIRIIKFFAWEDRFVEKTMAIREIELSKLMKRVYLWCLMQFIWSFSPTVLSFTSFFVYTYIQGNNLTAPVAFTALSLFAILKAPIDDLSGITANVIQSKVSLDRVSKFLDEQETTKYEQLGQARTKDSPVVGFTNATFSWNSNSKDDFQLKDINIAFKEKALNVVIGPIGSGKTSLLLALLGEMELLSGNVYLPGYIPRNDLIVDPLTGLTDSVSYCSQTAWLLNDTIRNNIIFDSPMNQKRYDEVIHVCGLSRDFEILPAGDSTEIGEKGITLSGGQKQRVSLARALYSNSKYVLLDDCLSAVDSHTALWIYKHCITGHLMVGRTCILVTHNTSLALQSAEKVICLENGRVRAQGSPQQLLKSGHLTEEEFGSSSFAPSRNESSADLEAVTKNKDTDEIPFNVDEVDNKLLEVAKVEALENDGKLIENETKAEGSVSSAIYIRYGQLLGGTPMVLLFLFIFVLSNVTDIIKSWWLKYWSAHNEAQVSSFVYAQSNPFYEKSLSNTYSAYGSSSSLISALGSVSDFAERLKEEHGSLYYISIYALIGVIFASFTTLNVWLTFNAGMKASNKVFKQLLGTILGAKLRFFDKTPQGRIMNRFSKDIEALDQDLMPCAEAVVYCLVSCFATLVLISIITPGFLVFSVIIFYLYGIVGKYYLNLSRELKRFESISKSPIHQHFSESLNGVVTIRAYGVESRFLRQNLDAIDHNNEPFFYMWLANRWLSLRIDAVGALVTFVSAVFVMLYIGKIDAGLAGLSLTYAISFSEYALWVVRLYSEIEMQMNSVERILEYLDIEQEPPKLLPENDPPASWPEHGAIEVDDVSLRYDDGLPLVIKNVTFNVEPNNKIGIVGRTGAGKSTIITAFFRFLDPVSGSIKIDGVDICKIGLKTLRQAITIIPQDPTLFTGTIRSNLDPFDEYTDEMIFESLKRVNLVKGDESINSENVSENQNKFLDLSSTVTEGGGNLSQGQRQLMCLARSLLKNPKVIMLDEATASIDYNSDTLIQKTIREEFNTSTILTIAHRLRSIIDYDKILVMDAGTVVEFDHPHILLANKNGVFYKMCEDSGELDILINMANAAAKGK